MTSVIVAWGFSLTEDLGVGSSCDLQDSAGRCSQVVYSVVLKSNKHCLHLLKKLKQVNLSKQAIVEDPSTNDLSHP